MSASLLLSLASEMRIFALGAVDKSGGSGIIRVGSEGMYRKKDSGKIEPMPKKQLRKIEKSFKAKGGIIQSNAETDAYLDSKNAEAITYDAFTISA